VVAFVVSFKTFKLHITDIFLKIWWWRASFSICFEATRAIHGYAPDLDRSLRNTSTMRKETDSSNCLSVHCRRAFKVS